MAKKVKITKGGETVYPATVMDAVVHPDLRVDASKLIEEVNVSKIYPTGGIDGTNKYTLETAIAKIPSSLRNVGIKCSFLDEEGEVECWTYQGGGFTLSTSWMQVQVGEKNIYSLTSISVDWENGKIYSGTYQDNPSYKCASFFVSKGYKVTFYEAFSAYLINKNRVSAANINVDEQYIVTEDGYIVVNAQISKDVNIIVEYYGTTQENLQADDFQKTRKAVTEGVAISYKGGNLYNKNDPSIVLNAYYNRAGSLIQNSSYAISHFIEVKSGVKVYTNQTILGAVFFDDKGFVVKDNSINTDGGTSFVVPEGYSVCKISFLTAYKDSLVVSLDSTFSDSDFSKPFDFVHINEINTVIRNEDVFEISREMEDMSCRIGDIMGYVDINGNVHTSEYPDYTRSDYLLLNGGDIIYKAPRIYNNILPISFYSDDFQYIGTVSSLNNTDIIRLTKEDYTFNEIVASYVVCCVQSQYLNTTLLMLRMGNKTISEALPLVYDGSDFTLSLPIIKEYSNHELFTIHDTYIQNVNVITSLEGYSISDYIPLNSAPIFVSVYMGNFYTIGFYDKNKVGIKVLNENDVSGRFHKYMTKKDYTFNGVEAAYIVIGRRDVNQVYNSLKIYGSSSKKENNNGFDWISRGSLRLWAGKNVLLYGDSITQLNDIAREDSWGYQLECYLGCNIINRGWGATSSIANIESTGQVTEDGTFAENGADVTITDTSFGSWDRITKVIPANIKDSIDAVIIMGGTNELGNAAKEGDSVFYSEESGLVTDAAWKNSPYYEDWNGDFDRSGILGGFCSTVLKMMVWMPQAKIILCSPIGGGSYDGLTNAIVNGKNSAVLPISTAGLTLEDISKIIEKASYRMGVPFFDMYREASISTFNRSRIIADSVHPYIVVDQAGIVHNIGSDSIAHVMAGNMNRVFPLMRYDDFAEHEFDNITIKIVLNGQAAGNIYVKLVSAHNTFQYDGQTNEEGMITVSKMYGRFTYSLIFKINDVEYKKIINIMSSNQNEIVEL